jgi:hypothetical protein
MSISAQAAIDLGKEILEGAGGRGQSIPDVIELILKEAFQIVCIFFVEQRNSWCGLRYTKFLEYLKNTCT